LVIGNTHDFLLVLRCNFISILYRFRVFLTLNNIVTLKSGLEVTQDNSKLYHSNAWVRFPIHLL